MAANEGPYSGAGSSEGASAGAQHDQQQHWGIGGDGAPAPEKPTVPESSEGGIAEGLSSGILPCRKRKATEELPQIDEATAERLRRATDSLTKEQLRMLLARACSHYPGIFFFTRAINEYIVNIYLQVERNKGGICCYPTVRICMSYSSRWFF